MEGEQDSPDRDHEIKRQRLEDSSSSFHVASQLYGVTSKRIGMPYWKAGVVMGKGGETIECIQMKSGAKIQIHEVDPHWEVELTGTSDQISRAEELINEAVSESDAGGSGSSAAQGSSAEQSAGGEQYVVTVPDDKVELLGGETIQYMDAANVGAANVDVEGENVDVEGANVEGARPRNTLDGLPEELHHEIIKKLPWRYTRRLAVVSRSLQMSMQNAPFVPEHLLVDEEEIAEFEAAEAVELAAEAQAAAEVQEAAAAQEAEWAQAEAEAYAEEEWEEDEEKEDE